MRKKSELFFNTVLLPIDFLAVMGSFVLAYIIRVKIEGRPVPNPLGIELFLKIFLLIMPVWILIFALAGLYSQSSLRGRFDELGKIFVAVSGGTMFLILLDFISRQPLFPAKSIPIYGYGFSLVLVTMGRQLIRAIQRYLFGFNIGIHQALLVGSGPIAKRIAQDLSETHKSGYRLIGAIDNARGAAQRLKGITVYKSFNEALNGLVGTHIDEIIQGDSALEPDEIMDMVNYASNHHIGFKFVPNQFGIYATNTEVSHLAGLPIIEIKHTPLDGWGRVLKRVFDVLGALLGLAILLPLFAVIALAIKLTDSGPVFYRHRRVSRVGKPVNIFKFRSMYNKFSTGVGFSGKSDAQIFAEMGKPELAKEFAKEQKLVEDPRVTVIGRFLRRTSLDELPQLLNVLSGQLSLVGPRPVVESELERYGEGVATFLALKPGMTGLWQISGRSDLSYEERVKLDIYYVENWSLWLDIKILIKTVAALVGRGAY